MEEPSVAELKKLLSKLLKVFPKRAGPNDHLNHLITFILAVLDSLEFKDTFVGMDFYRLVVSAIKEAMPRLSADLKKISAGSTSIDDAVSKLWSLIKDNVSSDLVPAKNLLWFMKQALSGERGSDFYSSLGGAFSVIHTWLVEAKAVELLETALKAAQLAKKLQVVAPPPSIVPSSTLDDPGY